MAHHTNRPEPPAQQTLSKMIHITANRVRAQYIERRLEVLRRLQPSTKDYRPGPFWDGGLVKRGAKTVKRESIWRKLAKWYLRNGLDPDGVITAVFQANAPNSPLPNQLMGPRAAALYLDRREFNNDVIRSAFKTQQTAARHRLLINREAGIKSKDESWSLMLQDLSLPLSALFRYCLADSEGYRELAKRFHRDAMLQYLGNFDIYNEVWKKWIPATFRKEAERWRAAVGLA